MYIILSGRSRKMWLQAHNRTKYFPGIVLSFSALQLNFNVNIVLIIVNENKNYDGVGQRYLKYVLFTK